jgi:hypothetical protein
MLSFQKLNIRSQGIEKINNFRILSKGIEAAINLKPMKDFIGFWNNIYSGMLDL